MRDPDDQTSRQVLAAVRLVGFLNALRHGEVSAEVAARSVIGDDVAHHVVDTDGLLGLDPVRASDLDPALTAVGLFVDSDWLLCLPRPGAPAGLGGAALAAALANGVAVAPVRGGVVFVPHAVGAAIQWAVLAGTRVGPLPQAYEAERALAETIVAAGRQLAGLAIEPPAGGRRTRQTLSPVLLAPGYPSRHLHAADRAWRLFHACSVAIDDESGQLSSYEVASRFAVLRTVRDCAADALTAACVWPHQDGEPR